MQTTSLPKSVTSAAIPRRVRVLCQHLPGGKHVFCVADATGKQVSRTFTGALAFATFIKRSYPVVA